jgi:xanthine/CO dehydrogenase XdhC/CoxF family maturation factor
MRPVRDILGQIEKWWDAGETFGLATVVRTFHSAPREPGAALAVSAGGEVIGSVSGGCVEGAVYELAQQVCQSGQPVLQRYGSATTPRCRSDSPAAASWISLSSQVSKERFHSWVGGGRDQRQSSRSAWPP